MLKTEDYIIPTYIILPWGSSKRGARYHRPSQRSDYKKDKSSETKNFFKKLKYIWQQTLILRAECTCLYVQIINSFLLDEL